ncbi:hypothetical protein ONS95_005655 [Cadophora gregata]|uniref:uncharacterized protein n=1 Tax=Cadophora gregata TaxID=51156 RepID=UPI0026DC824E|nr:uncharacterized protein ONS95_005655 [Cadophora gregata]KAK0103643.1 hypothetical protein ONS95_005655 [Cadophora gregata]
MLSTPRRIRVNSSSLCEGSTINSLPRLDHDRFQSRQQWEYRLSNARDRLSKIARRGFEGCPNFQRIFDFHHVANVVRYSGFRKQLNKLSEPKVLGRRVTEAAFLKVLLRKCAAWDASELSRKHPGGEMLHKNKLLRDAVDQLVGTEYRNRAGKLVIKDDVEGCWKERALLCPGLDVDFLAYDMTDAELAEEDARLAEEVEMEHDIQMGEAQSDENEYSAPETEKMVLVQSPFRPLEMEM